MKWVNTIQRWTMRGIHSMILATALVGPASMAFAQGPGSVATKGPRPAFSKSLGFNLPVNMAPELRANVAELRLYSRTPTTDWKLQESGPQFVTRFSCKVPQEGEYWYSLVTVDSQGRATPADVKQAPAQMRVVVDTTPPTILVESGNSSDGDLCMRCTIQDANPDPASLKAVCKTDAGDLPLETVPGLPNVFRIKGPEPMRFPVVITARDLADNVGTKEVNVRDLIGATLAVAPTPMTPPSLTPPMTAPPMATPPTPSKSSDEIKLLSARPDPNGLPPLPPPRFEGPAVTPPQNLPNKVEQPSASSGTSEAKVDLPVSPGLPSRVDLPTPPSLNLVAGHSSTGSEPNINLPKQSPAPSGTQNSTPAAVQPSAPTAGENAPRGNAPHQLINTTLASVDYRIDQVGPSGVGKVEIYMTPDQGNSWHRLGEDADKRSPAEINLPGDGVYGIRIAISNGNGFGGRPPARGETPHCLIEVDTTSPFVQLRSADVLPSTGQVEIRWNASDRNLGATPVNLFYRTATEGPWQVVARGLKNDGLYRWNFPRDANSRFFFKIEVADQAGNVSHDVTRQPVVIDVTEPRATVVGVTGSSVNRPFPGGN